MTNLNGEVALQIAGSVYIAKNRCMVFDVVDRIPIAVSLEVEIFEYCIVGSQRFITGKARLSTAVSARLNAKTRQLRATVRITLPI